MAKKQTSWRALVFGVTVWRLRIRDALGTICLVHVGVAVVVLGLWCGRAGGTCVGGLHGPDDDDAPELSSSSMVLLAPWYPFGALPPAASYAWVK